EIRRWFPAERVTEISALYRALYPDFAITPTPAMRGAREAVAKRPAYSALALHAETSSVTAIGNDYGFDHVYARQVAAHGRPGDVLMLLSTSGRSANLVAAAVAARRAGLGVWALTGPGPNPLMEAADESLCVAAASTATVQEVHLVAVHLLCECFDTAVAAPPARTVAAVPGRLT
ncbi:SIS domain-containing protein, partial [Streptomyces althioticus]|uniref:D-sedoheptulose-7-phosphate isomerase n=1 Tax=Streptomyces althioticus TaxID=83380 RepID=UPI0033E79CFB